MVRPSVAAVGMVSSHACFRLKQRVETNALSGVVISLILALSRAFLAAIRVGGVTAMFIGNLSHRGLWQLPVGVPMRWVKVRRSYLVLTEGDGAGNTAPTVIGVTDAIICEVGCVLLLVLIEAKGEGA